MKKGKKKEKKKNKKNSRLYMLLAVLFLLIGICMLSYPWVSNYLYENRAVSEIAAYTEAVEELDADSSELYIQAAREYNECLREDQSRLIDPFDESELDESYVEDYWTLLDFGKNGVMGYLEIPSISVYLPVYHGTEESTLLAGIGHLRGSSLPVGGEGTHAVVTGHCGLSSAKMFTDLEEMEIGDYFYVHILDEVLAYQVVSIAVTEPDDVKMLRIEDGRDLVTLLTCTPYGINSHRLLVTGERVEYTQELYETSKSGKKSVTDSKWMKSYLNAAIWGIVLSAFLLLLLRIGHRLYAKRARRKHMDAGEIRYENRKQEERMEKPTEEETIQESAEKSTGEEATQGSTGE